jgi:DNA invertase Pin-like site-specific DNA recombinase
MQRSAIEKAASARGDVVESWYAEKQSARTMDRAELRRLQADAAAGRIARLYLFRLDRLTRTGIADTLTAVEALRTAGVDVVSIADGFDLNGPCSEVVIAVMAWAAKMERLARNERVAAARERIEAQGGKWGRPSTITDEQTSTARRMHEKGASIRKIAMAIGVKRSVIGRALKAA